MFNTQNLKLLNQPSKKFRSRYISPYKIIEKIPSQAYKLDLLLNMKSACNSHEPGPARSGRRPSGGRCYGVGAIGGEIAPPPQSHVSLATARSDGHKNSETR